MNAIANLKECVILFLCVLSFTLSSQSNVIMNGDFETGDLSGWTSMTFGSALGWNINDGTYTGTCVSNGPLATRQPISGNFDIISDQSMAGMNLVSTGFVIPDPFTSASISWDMLYDNRLSAGMPKFQDPNQEFRVVILDSSMMPIDTVWSTDPGDPDQVLSAMTVSETITDPLMGREGEMIYLLLQEDDNLGCFNVAVDNISLVFSQAAIPTLNQWGILILSLILSIIGVSSLKYTEKEVLN
ncbi:MAG: IPTL-CTERM sorting domain-containing protein [Saprospiraceae bacterium]|nr:IPTL-CTERM sorting domain-containing protein [Saprospiraceae bacterium]